MKTGPNDETEFRCLGLWYVSFFFFRVLFILTYSFFFLVSSTLSHNKQPPQRPNDAPPPHEQHHHHSTTTTERRRCSKETSDGKPERQARDVSRLEPQVCFSFFSFFFILLMIYLLTGRLRQCQHQHLAPIDTNGKKGPNDGFIVWALGSFFFFVFYYFLLDSVGSTDILFTFATTYTIKSASTSLIQVRKKFYKRTTLNVSASPTACLTKITKTSGRTLIAPWF